MIPNSAFMGAFLGLFIYGFRGGIIGFIAGFALHYLINSSNEERNQNGGFGFFGSQSRTNIGGFSTFLDDLLVLIAAVMKADGKIMKSELNYVKQFLVRSFGEYTASNAILRLREILKEEVVLDDITFKMRSRMDYSVRLQMLHLLFGISGSDGVFDEKEVKVIEQIAAGLGLQTNDIQSIKSMFIKDTESAYKILEISKDATDTEIKKAYRKMAMKHHPDKVAHMGEELKKSAEDKFRAINDAYETIKKERNIS